MAITSGMKDITQGIISSYDARIAWEAQRKGASAELKKELTQGVAARKSEVKGMRNGFQSAHKEMSTELRKSLAQGETERKEVSAGLKKELTQGVAARKSEVKGMLNGFQSSHKAMSTELRKSLAESQAERKKASAELEKELVDYVRGIKGEVAGMRQETRADLREASAAWQELAVTMRAKRARVEVPPKVEIPVPEEEVPVEEEIPDLEAKLLAAVRDHPAGITLAEVAESLGVAPIVLGRASRKLLGEGKIRKEDKDYFPASTE